MNIIRQCVYRPIAVAMIYLVLVALGVYFFIKTPVRQLPNVTRKTLTVSASWPNTSAETVEAFVTSPIEAVVNTVKGVKTVSSTSREGIASVSIEFIDKTDMDFAALELKEKLAILKGTLPNGVTYPTVSGYNPESYQFSGVKPAEPQRYTLTGPYTLSFLREFAENEIKPNLMAIEYVGEVEVIGGQPRVLRVDIDPGKAEMYNIREGTVSQAIRTLEEKQNIGYLQRSGMRYDVYVQNTADDVKNIGDLLVAVRGDRLILLKEIATIIDTYEEPQSYYRINGNPVVNLTIKQEEATNLVLFVKEVGVRINELKAKFSPGMDIIQENDPSLNIKTEIKEIEARGLFSILMVFLVLYVFIRSLRVPFVIMTTIFFSALITVIIFYAAKIDFNVMTIAGLSLGFGMLVDSSIVVIDNVFRYRERGAEQYESVEKGAREVFLPVVASVLTTIIVFIPFVYLQGERRDMYIPLALAVIFSLTASVAVAFTFIPAYLMKIFPYTTETFQTRAQKNRLMNYIRNKHIRLLEYMIFNKYITILVVILIFGGSWWLFKRTVPSYSYSSSGYDSGTQETYVSMSATLPLGSTLERSNAIAQEFEDRVLGNTNIRKVTANVTSTSASVRAVFADKALNTSYPWQLMDEFTSHASTFAGININVSGVGQYFYGSGLSSSSARVNFRIGIYGYNYNECARMAESLGKEFEGVSRFGEINPNYYGYGDRLDVVITVNRDRLKFYDVDVQNIVSSLDTYLRRPSASGTSASVTVGGKVVKYAIKMKKYQEFEVEDLKNILITNQISGEQVRLSDVAHFEFQKVMGSIRRNNQQYERILAMEFRGPQQKGREEIDNVLNRYVLPTGYTIKLLGYDSGLFSTKNKVDKWIAILLALVLVFMVTASLYESFLHPFVIMLTVPLALIGVFLIYFFMAKNFSDAAYIGVILLSGIVVNNAIILVDHINLLRSRGQDLYAAVIQGSQNRVRAILMTSVTTILGMLPLILKGPISGYDTKIWYYMALSTIGGLLSSTPLTLLIIPVFYIVAEEWRRKIRTHWEKV